MIRKKPSRQQVTQTQSVPAPIGGLNARDSIAAMPPTDAIVMNNWFPTPAGLDVRGGSIDWGTGITGWVESIMVYNGLTSSKMFAAAGTVIYDVTNTGVATAMPPTFLTLPRWQYANFGTAGGNFLIMVNGIDRMLIYDGTNFSPVTTGVGAAITSITNGGGTTATLTTATPHNIFTGTRIVVIGATPAAYNGTFYVTVTGPNTFTYPMLSNPGGNASAVGTYSLFISITVGTPATWIYVAAFKSRLYFIEKNSLHVWYLPVAQVGGVAALFDLSSVFKLGGKLVAMQSWNVDTVSGPNDYLAFFTDKGEVVVYQGFDPTQQSTWSLVGNFRIGRPASGNRMVTKVGSDLYAITVDGLIPLSKAMLTDRSQGNFAVSEKIQNLINTDVATYANNFGWQVTLFPVGNKIIVNVPQNEDAISYQYVCNTITGAWTVFSGWNAACFDIMGDSLFFGTNGKVVRADVGSSDNGVAIITDLKPAFSSFGMPGQNKQYTMVRPIFGTSGSIGISVILNIDFRDALPTSALNLPAGSSLSLWNVALWNVSFWSQTGIININWESVAGVGFYASLRMKTISQIDASLYAIDYGYQPGGIY